MRTTLTLDPDVAAMLKKAVAGRDVSFKQAVNDALRRGLMADSGAKPKRRFVQRLMPEGQWLIDINDNGAIWQLFDREDYGDLSRREPTDPGDRSEGD